MFKFIFKRILNNKESENMYTPERLYWDRYSFKINLDSLS